MTHAVPDPVGAPRCGPAALAASRRWRRRSTRRPSARTPASARPVLTFLVDAVARSSLAARSALIDADRGSSLARRRGRRRGVGGWPMAKTTASLHRRPRAHRVVQLADGAAAALRCDRRGRRGGLDRRPPGSCGRRPPGPRSTVGLVALTDRRDERHRQPRHSDGERPRHSVTRRLARPRRTCRRRRRPTSTPRRTAARTTTAPERRGEALRPAQPIDLSGTRLDRRQQARAENMIAITARRPAALADTAAAEADAFPHRRRVTATSTTSTGRT